MTHIIGPGARGRVRYLGIGRRRGVAARAVRVGGASLESVSYAGDVNGLLDVMPDRSAKLVITSPPYNIGKEYERRAPLAEYVASQEAVIARCAKKVHPRGSICWQTGNYVRGGQIEPLDALLYPAFRRLGLRLRNRIVWHFGHGLHCSRRLSGRYETILWFTAGDDYTFNLDPIRVPAKYPSKRYFRGKRKGELSCNPLGKNPSDVWEIPNVKHNHREKTAHPAQFPVELVERLVLSLTDEGDYVLDPYMGSGSTAIAALMHGRHSIGAEVNPEYYGIWQERISLLERGEIRLRPMGQPVYGTDEWRRAREGASRR